MLINQTITGLTNEARTELVDNGNVDSGALLRSIETRLVDTGFEVSYLSYGDFPPQNRFIIDLDERYLPEFEIDVQEMLDQELDNAADMLNV